MPAQAPEERWSAASSLWLSSAQAWPPASIDRDERGSADSGGQFARAVDSPDGALAGGEPGGYLRPPAAGTRRSLLSLGGRALRVGDRGVDLAHSAGEVAGRLGFDVRLPADVGLIGQFRIVLGALVPFQREALPSAGALHDTTGRRPRG